ncbi:hypothetical protein GCM10018966_007390 [Streptomyces yanii]
MKISQTITSKYGSQMGLSSDDVEAGMKEKSEEFAASGNRVYLPLAETGGR